MYASIYGTSFHAVEVIFLISLLAELCTSANVSPFPYKYWTPTSQTISTTEKPTTKQYKYFYGNKIENVEVDQNYDALPIKVPNDLVSDVQYVTRVPNRGSTRSKIKRLVRNSWPSRLLNRWKNRQYEEEIERKRDAPKHEFYPIESSSGLTINLLQKDGQHLPYQPGYKPNHIDYNILNYDRYHYPREKPVISRKKYNENIIDLMTQKMFGQENGYKYPYATDDPFITPKPTIQTSNFPQLDQSQALENHYNNYESNLINSDYQTQYTPPPKSNYTPSKKFTDWLKSKTADFLKVTFSPLEDFNLPGFQFSTTVKPNHYLYYYTDNKNNADYYSQYDYHNYPSEESTSPFSKWFPMKQKTKGNSLMERIASIQQSPAASLLIPGGVAALGMGLALYYFNYVWYPTPVVTAKMLKIFSNFMGSEDLNGNNDLDKIVQVFRSLETTEGTSEDCRKRLICQLHQEIPGLYDVTKTLSPLINAEVKSQYVKPMNQYFNTAEEGRNASKSCKDIYTSCSSEYIPLRPFVNSIFKGISNDESDNMGESRVL